MPAHTGKEPTRTIDHESCQVREMSTTRPEYDGLPYQRRMYRRGKEREDTGQWPHIYAREGSARPLTPQLMNQAR